MTTTMKKSSRVGITEVAKYCGQAPSTVSGVLNKRADCRVSEKTREKIMDAVAKLGYRPNLTARSLVSGKSNTLGMISTAQDIEPTTRIATAFEAEARKNGFMLLITFDPNDPEMEDKQINWLDDRRMDGLFLMPSETGDHLQLKSLMERKFPVVTLDGLGRLDVNCADVSVDYYEGGCMQAEHLLSLGRKRVCVANSVHSCWVVDQRIAGLQDTLLKAGAPKPLYMNLPFEARPIMDGPAGVHDFIRAFMLKNKDKMDAVVGTGDEVAMTVMGIAMNAGIRVPDEIAFAGCDGISFSANPFMPLTTIASPHEAIGQAAFKLLHTQIKRKNTVITPKMQLTFKPELVVRKSTVS